MRPGIAKRFSAGFHREPRRFRTTSPGARRQFRCAVDNHLFSQLSGQLTTRDAPQRLPCCYSVSLWRLSFAQNAWLGRRSVYDPDRRGRQRGAPVALPARRSDPELRSRRSLGDPHRSVSTCNHPVRRIRPGLSAATHTFTLEHFWTGFAVEQTSRGWLFSRVRHGTLLDPRSRSRSFPLRSRAVLGLLTAYLLVRQRFTADACSNSAPMLSFAIPGTVIGVSAVYSRLQHATHRACWHSARFLSSASSSRNMPVGVRAGVAALSQNRQEPR